MEGQVAVSQLVQKRAELMGDMERLKEDLLKAQNDIKSIDRTIRIFDPEYPFLSVKPKKRILNRVFKSGELKRLLLDLLKEKGPLSAKQLTYYVQERELNIPDNYDLFVGVKNSIKSMLRQNILEDVGLDDNERRRYTIKPISPEPVHSPGSS